MSLWERWYQGWAVVEEKKGPGRGWWGPPKGTHGPEDRGKIKAVEVKEKLKEKFSEYADQYGLPELTGGYEYGSTGPDHIVEFWHESGTNVWGVRVNKDFIESEDFEDWIQQSNESNWILAKNLDDLITHEAGHYLYRTGRTWDEGQAISKAFKESRYQAFRGMSRLGSKNESEFFAETLVLAKNNKLRSLDRHTYQALQPVFESLEKRKKTYND